MLCSTCSDIFTNLSTDSWSRPHHANFTDMRAAASSGCHMCFAFWNQYSDIQQDMLCQQEPGVEPRIRYRVRKPTRDDRTNGIDLTLWISSDVVPKSLSTDSLVVFSMSMLNEDECEDHKNGGDVSQSHNTSSDETWDLIYQLLDHCRSTHPHCRQTIAQQTWYPSRLLLIDHVLQKVRLLETAQTRCNGPYLTLSYRWKNIPTFLLTTSTYLSMIQGFPASDMPLVFQDAVTVCCRLGVQLVWIDALCIKQDSDDSSDWARESLEMDKVYSNAFLNISAAAATDAERSFFVNRDLAIFSGLIVDAAINGAEEKRFRVKDRYLWHNEVESVPLNLRGWVFQERLLSQRVLRFGRNQVTWECASISAAESFPDGVPGDLKTGSEDRISASFVHLLQRAQHERNKDGRRMIYQVWGDVVFRYTACSLTRSEDKLVALAGIAKAFASFANTEYVAGLWKSDLENGLLWHVYDLSHDEGRPSRRSGTYRAPSWSWASIDGRILPNDSGKQDWTVLEVTLDLVSKDEMSPIKNAHLLLKCKVARGSVSELGLLEFPWNDLPPSDSSAAHNVGESESPTFYVNWDESSDRTAMAEKAVYLALAGFQKVGRLLWPHGLVLQHVDGSQQAGIYTRCGYWSQLVRSHEQSKYEDIFEQAGDVPCVRREGDFQVIRLK